MITLYQFDPAFGLPNGSPFCMKVETWLRMAGIPYTVPPFSLDILRKAPKGKLPYIEDQGKLIADSTAIVEHLKAVSGDKLDAHLSAPERAVALAFQRMLEENLYWAVLHSRWILDAGWALTRPAFFGKLPAPLKLLIPNMARKTMRKNLYAHGMGRHSDAEILAIATRDINALADFLGDKPFMMGGQPSSLDAIVYSFAANLLWGPGDWPGKAVAQARPNLLAYCERMKARYYAT